MEISLYVFLHSILIASDHIAGIFCIASNKPAKKAPTFAAEAMKCGGANAECLQNTINWNTIKRDRDISVYG